MGLFDLFGKKKQEKDIPQQESPLEQALRRAATDTSARKEFYRVLLESDLYLITNDSSNTGKRTAQAGEEVSVIHLNDGSVPVFTSIARIYDKEVVKEPVHYIAANSRSLLEMIQSAPRVILNPFSDHGKELLPDEISSILDGTIFNDHNEIVITEPTQVMIGEPAVYPAIFVEQMKVVLKKHNEVKSAYLALIAYPGKQPHYLVALDAGDMHKDVVVELGPLALQYVPNEPVDFMTADSFDYFTDKEPFYKR